MCWGNQWDGRLGNDDLTGANITSPTQVVNIDQFKSISSRAKHTCAVLDNGSAMCWGYNSSGQLGISGSTANSSIPVAVNGLASVKEVNVSKVGHTCAVLDNGSALCWGKNNVGQLGNGIPGSDSPIPVAVNGLGPVKSISAGSSHTCALLDNGSAMCWGDNSYGQLGNNNIGGSSDSSYESLYDSATPVHVSFDQPVKSISAGTFHTCAILDNNSAMCWGYNSSGQLGNGIYGSNSPIPVAVNGLGPVKSISAGTFHTCAILSDDSLKCWGGNGNGQLGNGAASSVNAVTPVSVSGLSGVKAISAGSFHTCALLSNQRAKCWGKNDWGQLGNGSSGTDNATPDNVLNLSTIRLP